MGYGSWKDYVESQGCETPEEEQGLLREAEAGPDLMDVGKQLAEREADDGRPDDPRRGWAPVLRYAEGRLERELEAQRLTLRLAHEQCVGMATRLHAAGHSPRVVEWAGSLAVEIGVPGVEDYSVLLEPRYGDQWDATEFGFQDTVKPGRGYHLGTHGGDAAVALIADAVARCLAAPRLDDTPF